MHSEPKQSNIKTIAKIPASREMEVYAACMEEVKRRTSAVYAILQRRYSTPHTITNIEFMCLQIRKILELIALANLAAHKEQYAQFHKEFAREWRAKRIFDTIEKINPGFYPIPTEQVIDPGTGKSTEVRAINKPFLTKRDFLNVYQQCSQLLHADNPYGDPPELPQLEAEIPDWIIKIKNLLTHHHVQLYSSEHQLWVLMNADNTGRVQVCLFEQINDPRRTTHLEAARKGSI